MSASPAALALALAVVATASGVAFAGGWPLCLVGIAAAVFALVRLPGEAPRALRRLTWAIFSAALLAALTVFTVRVAVPNIVSAGVDANHGVAVSTLRTFLWAEDQYARRVGHPGTLRDLAAPQPGPDGALVDSPLLRAVLRPLDVGVTVFTGYAYAIHLGPDPQTGPHYIAYAWPVLPGRSGRKVFCLDEREDIFEAESEARTPPYAGLAVQPAFGACLPPGAAFGARPVEGTGGDGAHWRRWKNRPTRRSGDAAAGTQPQTNAPSGAPPGTPSPAGGGVGLENTPPGGAPSAP